VLVVSAVSLAVVLSGCAGSSRPPSAATVQFVDHLAADADATVTARSGSLMPLERKRQDGMDGLYATALDAPGKSVRLNKNTWVDQVSPDGRYVLGWDGQRRVVIRLVDRHVVAQIGAGAWVALLPGGRFAVAFNYTDPKGRLGGFIDELLSGHQCPLRRLVLADLATRQVQTVPVLGGKDGWLPVGMFGSRLLVQRLVPGASECTPKGALLVDLGTGRADVLAEEGAIAAAVGESDRLWLSQGGDLVVLDGGGDVVRTSKAVVAVSIGGRVVYWSRPQGSSQSAPLRLTDPNGPTASDRAGVTPLSDVEELLPTPDGNSLVVASGVPDGQGKRLSLCSVPALVCKGLGVDRDQGASGFLAIVPAGRLRDEP
jgi:hypothetical protein